MSDHERWADAAGAYVLGAMPESELRRYEAHLEGCEICRGEVAELRPAAEALPVAAATMTPPPGLKSRIMAEVEREAALLAEAGPSADRPAPRPRRSRWAFLSGWRLAPVAATVLAAGVLAGVVIAGVGGGTRTYDATIDAAQVQGASAELEVSDGQATLVAENLPEPPPGETYQAWIKRPGVEAPEPSVLFLPRDGSATAVVPGAADDAEAVLVTLEPRRGSEEPSGPPAMTVPVS
jgi:anti-sigma-K factor RskA